MLIMLLADLRSAVIVTLVLPLAALLAFIMMRWYGLSANLMSLGGLAIGIGMMADGAVVMVENIHRHPSKPLHKEKHVHAGNVETVLYAAKEVGRPVVFGICIIIVVFLPLLTLEGFGGKMFAPLAFTIAFALLGSLILSLTFVPMLSTLLLKQAPHEHDRFHIRWLIKGWIRMDAQTLRAASGARRAHRPARARRFLRPRAAHRHGVPAPAGGGLGARRRRAPAQHLGRAIRGTRNARRGGADEIPGGHHGDLADRPC